MGPATAAFVNRELEVAAVCSAVPETGICRGSEVVRCTRSDEGPVRLISADCSQPWGQACAVSPVGVAACVDP